ncbi:M24 family metallopeptidase [Bradyrhizobium sp. LLZ17]|uniref:M24 family metallopeptidase n=1 Tax=Bradyrhizobium sp. LLZ17 TaxID=3239388 RepID=A0AB39XSP8_9BRAD
MITCQNEEPTFILRKMDAPAAIHQSFLSRDSIISYPESLIGTPGKDGYDGVIDHVHKLGLANRSVGLEIGDLTVYTVEKFKARLPAATIVDCTKAVAWIRGVKSELEIAIMREAAAIADAGIMRAAEVIRAGVREADAMAEISATLARGANGKVGTDIAGNFFCSSPRTGTSHIRWSEDNIRDGSQINLELGGVRHAYVSAMSRTFSVGAPSDQLRRINDAQLAGMEEALASVRPGVPCRDVANAFYRTIEKYGYKKESRCGYAIGIDWTEPTASFARGDETLLKTNMTFHLMLGNWIEEDFGYVVSDTIRVTETGVDVLTLAPRKLFELS